MQSSNLLLFSSHNLENPNVTLATVLAIHVSEATSIYLSEPLSPCILLLLVGISFGILSSAL